MKTSRLLSKAFAILLSLTLVVSGALCVFAEDDAAKPAIREIGESANVKDSDENVTISVEYPIIGNEEIDGQIEAWVKKQVEDFKDEIASLKEDADKIEGELTIGYDAYVAGERYVGVAETGMLTHSQLAHPADIVQTYNIDLKEGRLLTKDEILPEAGRDRVYELLDTAIKQIDSTVGPADETWLEHMVLTNDGLMIITPRGEHFASALGMQRITLSYDDLGDALGINFDEQTSGNGDVAKD